MPAERIRKPWDKPAPYSRKPGPKGKQARNGPGGPGRTTSAKSATKTTRSNLTLQDWLTVFAFIDTHPLLSQDDIVQHFATKPDSEGPLKFTQSTLSRKISERAKLESRVNSNPTALFSKRPRVVTRPDVEWALVIWLRSMEEKREAVTGAMLAEKRRRFEKEFDVPEKECLSGESWVQSFCKT